jgi:uncharacterized membrane protein YoaK (UPF0700 family)
MFRHQGDKRTFKHNLYLATTLSLIAGIVNSVGFLSIKTFTTNVTGHFAVFAEEILQKDPFDSFVFLSYVFSFFLGALASGLFTELTFKFTPQRGFVIPILLELSILYYVSTFDSLDIQSKTNQIAHFLLFAMGLQNALVTQISNSVVRTTHLTGLFTDLGIEFSQLLFYKETEKRTSLFKSIGLRIAIIFFFLMGCLLGGWSYNKMGFNTLKIASLLLLGALIFDNIKYQFYTLKRKIRDISDDK